MREPVSRVRPANQAQPRARGRFVLYWMTAARRVAYNFALQRAVGWARRLGRPLVVLEAVRADYPWASARLTGFILDGMRDNARALARRPVVYHPYVEPEKGAGKGLVEALAAQAAVVVTDDFPAFFLPRMLAATAARLDVLVEAVDSNGLLPMRAAPAVFPTALAFRRFLQGELRRYLAIRPLADPLDDEPLPVPEPLPEAITRRWPRADEALLEGDDRALAVLPIDQQVRRVATRGGSRAARAQLACFLEDRLSRYPDERSHPDEEAQSGLSPYLHFGHLSVHEIFERLGAREGWRDARLGAARDGKREGFWGMSREAEAFLDELVTWRELGLNFCARREDYDQFESLPEWAKRTLTAHARDKRPFVYDLATLEAAETHDKVWNAAQRQLVAEGRIHNYLRMLWGKKIIEWSATPRQGLAVMIELNNKYALDGRDPNSYSGIFWILGRYDRPWAPERPIFGVVRYMSSENTVKKLRIKRYLERWGS